MTDFSNSGDDAGVNGGGSDAIGDLTARLQELRGTRRGAVEVVQFDVNFLAQRRCVLDARAAALGAELVKLSDDYLDLRECAENCMASAGDLQCAILFEDYPCSRPTDAETVTKALSELNATRSHAGEWVLQLMRGATLINALLPVEGSAE